MQLGSKFGTLCRSQTYDLRFRRPTLYSAKLRGHNVHVRTRGEEAYPLYSGPHGERDGRLNHGQTMGITSYLFPHSF